jgi:ABC-type phosphate transport system substrate-binding protein
MDMSVQKRCISGLRALAVAGLSAIGCMVFASTSAAGVPPNGTNCVASDGKINGRGATFQEVAQQKVFAPGYRDDYCGNVAEQFAGDPAGNGMVTYNYPAAAGASATGSGAGLKAASCRTDAYSGSDIPYAESQLKELNAAPGTLVNTEGKGNCNAITTFTPPFQPNSPKSWPDEEAGKVDSTAPLMSFPVAGSVVAPMFNLTTATCGGKTPPASLSFTGRELSRIFGGVALTWNDAELVATNKGEAPAGLEGCTGAITRVVRQDNSGTTNIFKQYLIKVDNERTGAECAPGEKWSGKYFEGGKNTEWPGKQNKAAEGGAKCSEIVTGAKSGNSEEIAKLKETAGGIGYADLVQAEESKLPLANMQNATGTSFQPPALGTAANCDLKKMEAPPGINAEEAVGLNEGNNWGNDNETVNKTGNHENATNVGEKFPICGITFMLVYKGLDNGAVSNPISRLTADQRRTLYSYGTFILSSAAQELLSSSFYSPLPNGWLAKLRVGFQENF